MEREVKLAGYLLTETEWRELDEEHRRELLRALAGATPGSGRADDCYEASELAVGPR